MSDPTDGTQSGAGAGTAGGGTDPEGTPPEGTPPEGSPEGSGEGEGSKPETVSRAEFDKIMERMRAADQRATQREAELRQIRDKDLPEAEKAAKDRDEAIKRAEAAETALRTERINNAFLKDNTHKWREPAVALRLVDLSRVDISEGGEVTGLTDALKDLAKAHPYLLEPKGEGGSGSGGSSGGGSGAPPMNGRGGTDKTDPKKLAQRFPAMRTRVTPS